MSKDIQEKTERLVRAYNEVFSGDDGELVLNDLLRYCHVLDSTFNSDSHAMAYDQGKREVGLNILRKLDFDLGKFRKRMEDIRNE
jgi:hypothetical protein